MAKGTEIVKVGDISIDNLTIPPAQKKVMENARDRIATLASTEEVLKRTIEDLTEKVQKNTELQELKKTKKTLRQVTRLRRDAANAYNGALEVVLVDVEGVTLSEKFKTLAAGGSNAAQ